MSQIDHRTPRLPRRMLEDELDRTRIRRVYVAADMPVFCLEDGRVWGMPTAWSSRLSKASVAELQNYELIGHGAGLHSPDLDKYVSVPPILLGRRSVEHTSESEMEDR